MVEGRITELYHPDYLQLQTVYNGNGEEERGTEGGEVITYSTPAGVRTPEAEFDLLTNCTTKSWATNENPLPPRPACADYPAGDWTNTKFAARQTCTFDADLGHAELMAAAIGYVENF